MLYDLQLQYFLFWAVVVQLIIAMKHGFAFHGEQIVGNLPKLPGYTVEDPTNRKTSHPRTLAFKSGMGGFVKSNDGVAVDTASNLGWPVAANMEIPDEGLDLQNMNISQSGEFTPHYVALDGKVLRFEAFVKEDVPTVPTEGYRIRKFTLYYFLVDDSIRIGETKQENSGMPQGIFLKRHRVPRTSRAGSASARKEGESLPSARKRSAFITWEDLSVGGEVEIYGKVFVLCDCDAFTRKWYESKGVQMSQPLEIPRDPYFGHRNGRGPRVVVKNPDDQRARFLTSNKKVLRFYCVWDDRKNIYGSRRPFVLHFFLEDDTVEVCEVHMPNDGQYAFPKFLRRQKLPKDSATALQDIGSQPARFYTDADFNIGDRVKVFGRDFLIYDCDDFTKNYYREKFGIAHFPDLTDRIETPSLEVPVREIPPHTGFGSEADSLQSIYHLIPKAPKRNEAKMMDLAGKALRFMAKMETTKPEDIDRRFIITFYLSDDTVGIFEPPQQNSGVVAGKFLERSEQRNIITGEKFSHKDFVLGQTVVINKFTFRLLDWDKFSQTYIESNGANVRQQLYTASLVSIMQNLNKRYEQAREALRSAFHVMDKDRSGSITHEEFIQALQSIHFDIVHEDAGPLIAFFDSENKGFITYSEFCDSIVNAAEFPSFLKHMTSQQLPQH